MVFLAADECGFGECGDGPVVALRHGLRELCRASCQIVGDGFFAEEERERGCIDAGVVAVGIGLGFGVLQPVAVGVACVGEPFVAVLGVGGIAPDFFPCPSE